MDNEPPLDILIRPARVEDGERILQVQIESTRTLNTPDYTAEQIEAVIESVNYWHRLKSQVNEAVFVAETEGQVIGVSSLSNWGVVSALFVHPHCVRRSRRYAIALCSRKRGQKAQLEGTEPYGIAYGSTLLPSLRLPYRGTVFLVVQGRSGPYIRYGKVALPPNRVGKISLGWVHHNQ